MKPIWFVYPNTRGTAGNYIHGLLNAARKAEIGVCAFVSFQYAYESKGAIPWFFPLTERFEIRGKGLRVLRGMELLVNYWLILLAALVRRPVINIKLTDSFWLTELFVKTCKAARLRVVVTCLDVREHDGRLPARRLRIFQRADLLVVHSLAAEAMLQDIEGIEASKIFRYPYPAAPYDLILNPIVMERMRARVRDEFASNRKWFLFIGYVRIDKGIETLYRAWAEWLGGLDAGLAIVGKWPHELADLWSRFTKCANIRVIDERIDREELAAFIELADFVILPYHKYAHSGILYSCSFCNGAVIASDIPLFTELLGDYEFCFRSGDAVDLARVIRLAASSTAEKRENAVKRLNLCVMESLEKIPKGLMGIARLVT